MANNLFFHKYPYTDFHELNLSWVLEQVQDCVDKVEEFGERLTADEATISDHEDRIDVIEAWKTVISGQNLDSRLTAIEGSDIMDAVALSDVSSVTPDATKVRISFVKDTYTDGAKSAGSDVADIPAANDTHAGVLLPGDKAKLGKMTLTGNDIAFAGKVQASTPTGEDDLVTKAYADSLGITGVSPTLVQLSAFMDSFASDYGTVTTLTQRAWQYGYITMIEVSCRVKVTTEIPSVIPDSTYQAVIAKADITDTDYFPDLGHSFYTEAKYVNDDTGAIIMYPVEAECLQTGRINFMNLGSTIPVNTKLTCKAIFIFINT